MSKEDEPLDQPTLDFLFELERKIAGVVNTNTKSYVKKFNRKLDAESIVICLASVYSKFCYELGIDQEETCNIVNQVWENFENIGEFDAPEDSEVETNDSTPTLLN